MPCSVRRQNGHGLGSILPPPKNKDRLNFQLFFGLFLLNAGTAKGFISVLEGSVVIGVRGEEPVTLGPGQTSHESPNDIHTIGRNPSKTTPAKFLVFLINDKDAPIFIPGA